MLRLLLLIPMLLFANERLSSVLSTLDGDEAFDVGGCVNPITGEYYISESDIVVPGIEPIVISRVYISGGFESEFEKWTIVPHKFLEVKGDKYQGFYFSVCEPTGAILQYSLEGKLLPSCASRISNTSRGDISSKTWIKNNRIDVSKKHHPVLYAADGTKRYYQLYDKKRRYYRLVKEEKPNGNWIIYEYQRDNITKIYSTNPSRTRCYASVDLTYLNASKDIRFRTSDEREFTFEKIHIQRHKRKWSSWGRFKKPGQADEHLEFDTNKRKYSCIVNLRAFSEGRKLEINYFPTDGEGNTRVHKLAAPVGTGLDLHTTQTFDYHPRDESTDVLESNGLRRKFKYDHQNRPEWITLFDGNNKLSKIHYTWKDGLLRRKKIDTSTGPIESLYDYDQKGNVKKLTSIGRFTGEGADEVCATGFEYTSHDYVREIRHPSGKVEHFAYDGPSGRITTHQIFCHDELQSTTTYVYDADGLLIREIEKDETEGSYHHEKEVVRGKYSLPHIIKESMIENGEKKLLKKTQFEYDIHHNVIRSDHYDSQDQCRYSLHFSYDIRGNLLRSTDALGRETINTYDNFSNLIESQTPDSLYPIKNDYDFVNRLIATHHGGHHTHFSYDRMGYKIAETDIYGNTTYFTPDILGRPQVTTNPIGEECKATYDHFGKVLTETDPEGHIATTCYNSRSQILEQSLPGRGTEKNLYNLDGTLKKTIAPNGLTTEYTYDYQGRVLSKSTPYHTETFTYDAFNPLSHTHPDGQTTTYTYDGAGRKISETTSGLTLTYTYDSLGRVHKVQTGEKITLTEYDLLNRPILVIETDTDGITHSLIQTEYDPYGHIALTCKKTPAGNAIDRYTYDDYGRITHHINPLGQTTHTEYIEDHRNTQDQKVLKKITTNPNGTQTVEIHDVLGRVTQTQKISPFGDILVKTHLTYSPAGHILERQTNNTLISWEYNEAGQVIALHEPEGKSTYYTHDIMGNVISETKPDGTLIETTYDLLGRKTSLSAPNIHYTYDYDEEGRIHPSDTHLHYDSRGNILEETLASGLTFQKTYDEYSRLLSLTLPDHTTIYYTYDAYHLTSVTYQEHTNHIEYTYHLPTTEILPLDAGQITYTYNLLSQRISQTSPHATHSILALDPNGNVLATNTAAYTYDALDQLTSENSLTYTYDGLKNRTSKNSQPVLLTSNNQVFTDAEGIYTYDPNGNRTTDPRGTYSYDALNRLTRINSLTLTYDSFNRCLSAGNTLYLYNGQLEIGAYTDHITELRILTNTPFAEIGSARLIYLENTPYVPYHDLQGNLIHLQDTTTFTAFGEGAPIAPWGYQSKRHHAHLINFGRRHYDPQTATWLSPDPKGFTDHLNLYQYLHNNPLLAHDPFGLTTEEMFALKSNLESLQTRAQSLSDRVSQKPSFFSGLATKQRLFGALQASAGLAEVGIGKAAIFSTGGLAAPIGWPIMAHGLDQLITGVSTMVSGNSQHTATSQLLRSTGFSSTKAHFMDEGLCMLGTMGAAASLRNARSFAQFAYSSRQVARRSKQVGAWVLPEKGGGAMIDGRWYTEHALERMAPRTPHVLSILEPRALRRAQAAGYEYGTKEFGKWWARNHPNPRGIPPFVVESEIRIPGSTGIRVIINKRGDVVSTVPGGG